MITPINIVFLGTPAFAVPTLQHLLAQPDMRVLAVVSQPDRPAGRGHQLQPTPVKQAAMAAGVPVHQPQSIRKDEALLATLAALQPDVFVTIAFGQILNQPVLDIPKFGTVNVHASLLPLYRGANPIQMAIIDGQTETGLTTMLTDIGIDTGAMLLKATTPIGPDTTADALANTLSHMGGPLLADTLRQLASGQLTPIPQPHEQATHAPKLAKTDATINWNKSVQQAYNRIRGQYPWPGATLTVTAAELAPLLTHTKGSKVWQWHAQSWAEMSLKLHSVCPSFSPSFTQALAPGQLHVSYLPNGIGALFVGTQTNPLQVITCQAPGKTVVPVETWLQSLVAPAPDNA
jgi:methionyl-tRNA formyltransferase